MYRTIFHKYFISDFTVDVWGYDDETRMFHYTVIRGDYYKTRRAVKRYKSPDQRNPRILPHGIYIYVIDPDGKRHRLFLDC